MYSDSRKAQHNSFAHHRACLLFAKPPAATNSLPAGAPVSLSMIAEGDLVVAAPEGAAHQDRVIN
jgi:hypothetical protein